jgi:hypothetical protein
MTGSNTLSNHRPLRPRQPNRFIAPWIQTILQDETLFGDSAPHWKNQTCSEQAINERVQRLRFLLKHKAKRPLAVTNALECCAPDTRCGSAACPECGRATARYVAQNANNVLCSFQRSRQIFVFSLIPRMSAPLGALHTLDLRTLQQRAKATLKQTGVTVAIGGIDFSLNEHSDHKFSPHWQPQLWFLGYAAHMNEDNWSSLRSRHRPTKLVSRPLVIKCWDGRLNAFGYALKTDFVRRQTYTSRRRGRACRNTRNEQLRAAERFELFQFLHQTGLDQRAFFFGVRPTFAKDGVSLVPISRTVNQSDSTTHVRKR